MPKTTTSEIGLRFIIRIQMLHAQNCEYFDLLTLLAERGLHSFITLQEIAAKLPGLAACARLEFRNPYGGLGIQGLGIQGIQGFRGVGSKGLGIF